MSKDSSHAKKRKKTYYFHEEWESEFFFTNVGERCVCLICSASIAVGKKCSVERHFTQVADYRLEKVKQLKVTLQKQQSLFTKPIKRGNSVTEESFKVARILTKHKKPFTDGAMVNYAMTSVAETLLKDHKSKAEIKCAIADVQLSANTVASTVFLLASDAIGQLERDMERCAWFSLQCDESVDLSDTAQLAVF